MNSNTLPHYIHNFNSIDEYIKSLSEEKKGIISESIENMVGYPTELSPVLFDRSIIELMNLATDQWARASQCFLKDIYKSSENIYTQHQGLRHVVETSCYYARELREWNIGDDFPWDFSLSLDWQFSPNGRSPHDIQIIEINAGSIGGLERSAFVYHAMRLQWQHLVDFRNAVDGYSSYKKILDTCRQISNKFEGLSVNFQENDQPNIFGRFAVHPFREWLIQNDCHILSNWNLDDLYYDSSSGFYLLQGDKVANFWIQYYPVALDNCTKSYSGLGPLYKSNYEISHSIGGFWENYIKNEGFRRWHVFNPLGVDILNDKAILTYYNDIVGLYLGEKSIIPVNTYRCFTNGEGKADIKFIDDVFDDKINWVIKSRRDNREGVGVYVGRYTGRSPQEDISTWDALRMSVHHEPHEYVCQQFLEEPEIHLPDGRVKSFENRNFAWTYGKSVNTFDVPYIRCNDKGTLRNLSRKDGASILPVLVRKYR